MAGHLWDLASKKDSLWVRWSHTSMIKDQSLWQCQCPQDSSWNWQKIMKLCDSFHARIRYKVGFGAKIYTWYDN